MGSVASGDPRPPSGRADGATLGLGSVVAVGSAVGSSVGSAVGVAIAVGFGVALTTGFAFAFGVHATENSTAYSFRPSAAL